MSDLAGRAETVAAAFAQAHGRPPAGTWQAPGRVNLIGEHTDYNDGWVLPAAIDRQVVAAVAPRADRLVSCRSLEVPGGITGQADELAVGDVSGWPAYVLGVVWALRRAGVPVPGLDVVVSSDIPVGAGLSSSAGLEAAVGVAAVELAGSRLSATELARAAQRAETDVVGAPVGIMDQLAAVRGVRGSALLIDCRTLEVRPVPLHLAERGLALLVIDTRVEHAHAGGQYAARRASCEEAARRLGVPALRDADLAMVTAALDGELLRCARHVVTENARVERTAAALEAGDLAEVGRLFAASHASLREDFRVSCPELDLAVESAGQSGALGARMTGGGFGGCAIALVAADGVGRLREGVLAAFARQGWRAPEVFPVDAADGASRLV